MAKLIVHERSAPLREYLRLHLETAGHAVNTTPDCGAAERMILTEPTDLVIAGSAAQSEDGLQLLRTLRERTSTARFS